MKRTDLAYMAGIFDGEGCIGLNLRRKRKELKRGQYYVIAQVTNTNKWLLELFRFNFGGHIYLQKGKPRNCYQWKLCSLQAIAFLKALLPYLNLKKAQAELAIKFEHNLRIDRHELTDEEIAVREAQALLMKQLKTWENPNIDKAIEKVREKEAAQNRDCQLRLI